MDRRACGPAAGGRCRRRTVRGLAGYAGHEGAAAISLAQFALGVVLAGVFAPDGDAAGADALFHAINVLDGVKMLALAGFAAAGIAAAGRTGLLARWLTRVGRALVVTITISAVGYLFALTGPAAAAYLSLPLLLVFVTGAGLALARGRG